MSPKITFELPKSYARYKKDQMGENTVAIIGYGNQGRTQALNLRDSGFNVIIGNIKDDYRQIARKDGFKVLDIPKASKLADIIFLLIPDELQQEVFKNQIEPYMDEGDTLVFASGFNYYSKLVVPAKPINVLLLSPKDIGVAMREKYLGARDFRHWWPWAKARGRMHPRSWRSWLMG